MRLPLFKRILGAYPRGRWRREWPGGLSESPSVLRRALGLEASQHSAVTARLLLHVPRGDICARAVGACPSRRVTREQRLTPGFLSYSQSVSFRTYILGSALGLLPPLTLIVLFAEQVRRRALRPCVQRADAPRFQAMALLGYSLPETSEAALDAGMAAAAAVMGGEGGWGVALQALSLRAGSVAKMAATNVVAA